jgi:hypothetical protein
MTRPHGLEWLALPAVGAALFFFALAVVNWLLTRIDPTVAITARTHLLLTLILFGVLLGWALLKVVPHD